MEVGVVGGTGFLMRGDAIKSPLTLTLLFQTLHSLETSNKNLVEHHSKKQKNWKWAGL